MPSLPNYYLLILNILIMGYNTNKEPVGNTCPIINSVIRDANSIFNEIQDPNESDKQNIKDILDYMEEIRSANASLREWGNDLLNERNKKQEEIDELEKKVSNLESDYSSLEQDYNKLEKESEDLRKQIEDLESQL